MSQMEHISGTAQSIVDELAGQERYDPAYDQGRLDNETSHFRFTEAYMTEFDYNRHVYATVPATRQRQRIHDTMHFARFFGTYDGLIEGRPADDPLARAYEQEADSRGYDHIFAAFQKRFPDLRLKMKEIAAELKEEERLRLTDPQGAEELDQTTYHGPRKNDQAYYSSCAYLAMASIARGLDPHYQLEFLYQAA